MRLALVLLLTLGSVGCGDDDELVGDWFDCGSGSAPYETCLSHGVRYNADHTWADIDSGSLEGSDPYCGSTEPGHHGTWRTDWMVAQVKIFRDDEQGRSLEEMTVTIDGNLMTRECIACPDEYWRRASPSRYSGPCTN